MSEPLSSPATPAPPPTASIIAGALPPPSSGESLLALEHNPAAPATQHLSVGGPAVGLDHLGPIVLNTDGSISRISNWPEMTEEERATAWRLVSKRNAQRRIILETSLGMTSTQETLTAAATPDAPTTATITNNSTPPDVSGGDLD